METSATNDYTKPIKAKSYPAEGVGKHNFQEEVVEQFEHVKAKAVETYDSSIQVIRRNPVKSLAIALGLGLVAGYFFKRP